MTIEELVRQLYVLRSMAKSAGTKAKVAQSHLVEQTESEAKIVIEAVPYGVLTATRTDPKSRMEVNWAKLHAKLNGKQWKAITSELPDEKKLESEIVSGNIPIDVVNDCVTYVPREPYFKVEASHDIVKERPGDIDV